MQYIANFSSSKYKVNSMLTYSLSQTMDCYPDRGVGQTSAKHKLLNFTHACKIRPVRAA